MILKPQIKARHQLVQEANHSSLAVSRPNQYPLSRIRTPRRPLCGNFRRLVEVVGAFTRFMELPTERRIVSTSLFWNSKSQLSRTSAILRISSQLNSLMALTGLRNIQCLLQISGGFTTTTTCTSNLDSEQNSIGFYKEIRTGHNEVWRRLAITRSSRLIRKESLPVFYSINNFEYSRDTVILRSARQSLLI